MNSYLRYFVGSLVAIFLLGAALNFTLDPLGYFRNHGLHPGIFLGDRVWGDDRMVHDLSIDTYRPNTLIAGNSRVKHGFAVDDRQLSEPLGAILNLALPGANFDELDRYIRRILENQALSNLLIGLDVGQFLHSRDRVARIEHHHRLNSEEDLLPAPVKKLGAAFWSKNTYLASAKVMLSPHDTTLNGGANPETMLEILETSGHRRMTRVVEARMALHYSRFNPEVYVERMAAMDALLADVCLKNTSVRLFISPMHIRQLLLIREMGHLGLFFNWKAQLANRVSHYRQEGCPVTLTDFSTISRFTSEPFPEPGDKQHRMQWYWESSHYNHKMGRMVIDRLWNNDDSLEGFGENLTAENIAGWLDEERDNLNALVRNQPILVKEVSELVR